MDPIVEFAKSAGLPAGVVVGLAVVGYVLRAVYSAAKTLSLNPGLGAHMASIEGTLKAVVGHQQDATQHLSSMDSKLGQMATDIAIIKDRSGR